MLPFRVISYIYSAGKNELWYKGFVFYNWINTKLYIVSKAMKCTLNTNISQIYGVEAKLWNAWHESPALLNKGIEYDEPFE